MAETTGVNSQASDVDAVNAAAAAEQADAAAEVEVATTETQDTTGKVPTAKPSAPEQSPFDAQKSYTDLERSYKELQKFSTQTAQDRSELRKHLQDLQSKQEKLLEMIQKATEAPFNPVEFKREFDQKGPAALEGYFKKMLDARENSLRADYDKRLEVSESKGRAWEMQYEVSRRGSDMQNYPNFSELYPKMCELAKNPGIPVDLSKPIPEVLDALYLLAKSQSSEEAVKIAAGEARTKAEAEVAKESKTTVATGGRKGVAPAPNLDTMPMNDLEKYVIQLHGVADRD